MHPMSIPEPGQVYIEVEHSRPTVSRWEVFPTSLPSGTALAAENAGDLQAQAEELLRRGLGVLPADGRYPWPAALDTLPVFAPRARVEVFLPAGAGELEQEHGTGTGLLYRVRPYRGLLVIGADCYPVARVVEESLTETRQPNLLLRCSAAASGPDAHHGRQAGAPRSAWTRYAGLADLAGAAARWVRFDLRALESARQWAVTQAPRRDAASLLAFQAALQAYRRHNCTTTGTDLCLCRFSYACGGCLEPQVVSGESLIGHQVDGLCEECAANR